MFVRVGEMDKMFIFSQENGSAITGERGRNFHQTHLGYIVVHFSVPCI